MRSIPSVSLALLALLGCGRARSAQAPCASGPAGFTAYPAACTHAACRACVSELDALWSRRAQPAARAAFRTRFMRASSDARDEFARRRRPDGTYPFEHCTAGLAPGSSCITWSPYCVGVITDALRSGATPVTWRVQLDVAVGKSCDRSRDELVRALRACEPVAARDTCTDPRCVRCLTGHLAAVTVLAPVIERAERLEQFIALIDETPEVVARAAVDALGGPETPADIDAQVAQRAVRHHCVSLLRRSAAAPPMVCDGPLGLLLSDAAYGDHERAWTALAAATPASRASAIDALLSRVSARPALPEAIVARLDVVPAPERAEALERALARPLAPTMYAALRARLALALPSGSPLPPETQRLDDDERERPTEPALQGVRTAPASPPAPAS